jgi:hypothetical protein
MLKNISLDNPLIIKIAFLVFGLFGFIIVQVLLNKFNLFSFYFVFLSTIELLFFIYIAIQLEKKEFWNILKINSVFATIVLLVKFYLLFLLLQNGFVNSFDDRLAVYGNSFLIGVSMAVGFVLFPLLPLYASSKIIRHISMYLWIFSTVAGVILAPSKSVIIGIIASLLFYRFLRRKTYKTTNNIISLFSLKSLALFLFVIIATFLFIYIKVGNEGFNLIIHRVANNFDLAIYASKISPSIYPEHSNLFYAILPILKKFNPDYYNLDYFSIPQWVLYEVLNTSRYSRFGYPNDNLIVGLLLSYKEYGILLFFLFAGLLYIYIRYFIKLKKITLFHLLLLFSIPSIFASLQDTMIKFYTFIIIYIIVLMIYTILPKKRNLIENNLR